VKRNVKAFAKGRTGVIVIRGNKTTVRTAHSYLPYLSMNHYADTNEQVRRKKMMVCRALDRSDAALSQMSAVKKNNK